MQGYRYGSGEFTSITITTFFWYHSSSCDAIYQDMSFMEKIDTDRSSTTGAVERAKYHSL